MARHGSPNGDAITYRWRFTSIETPRWLDLHPVINNWRGPRWLVVAVFHLWRHMVRSHVDFRD